MMFLWIIIAVVFIYLLVDNNWFDKDTDSKNSKDSLQILKNRLARGEITKTEYENLKQELEE